MAYDDYLPPGIEDDEEARLRRGGYMPPIPVASAPSSPPAPAADGYAPVAPPPPAPIRSSPVSGSTEDLESRVKPEYVAPQPTAQRPTWNQYAPPERHGLSKFGSILASINPVADRIVNQLPQERAKQNYDNATSEFDKTEQQRVAAEKADSDEAEKQARASKESGANAVTADKNKNAHADALRRMGLTLDANNQPVAVPYEQMSVTEQGHADLMHAQTEANAARADMERAKNDPQSPIFRQAAQRLATAQANAKTAAGRLGIEADKFNADYLGHTPTGEALPGATVDEHGHPIGPKVANAAAHNDPTAQRANKADLAVNIQQNATDLQKLIDREPALFGKIAGHYTSAREMIGSDDANIQRVGVAIHNMAQASGGIHGLRSAQGVEATERLLLNHFRNGTESTKAGLDEMSRSAQTFIDAAKLGKKAPAGGHAETAAPSGQDAKSHKDPLGIL